MPTWPYHDCSRSAGVASGGTLRAIAQLTICAARMPITTVSWLIDTSRPRRWLGTDLGDIRGRQRRRESDAHAADPSRKVERREVAGQRRPNGANREQNGRDR